MQQGSTEDGQTETGILRRRKNRKKESERERERGEKSQVLYQQQLSLFVFAHSVNMNNLVCTSDVDNHDSFNAGVFIQYCTETGTSHAMTASPKPSCRAPWRVGNSRQQRKCWMANITAWTLPILLTTASCRKNWKRISDESPLMSPSNPIGSKDWTELNWTVHESSKAYKHHCTQEFHTYQKRLTHWSTCTTERQACHEP